MGEQAQKGVRRERVAALEKEHRPDDHRGDGEDAHREVGVEKNGDGDAKQGGVGNRLAEIGETTPDDEASGRPRNQCQPDPGE